MLRSAMLGLIGGSMLAGATASAAVADEIETLPRTSAWDINYDEDSCSLLAQFGAGDRGVKARLMRYQPSDVFDLTLYGERFGDVAMRASARIDFGLGTSTQRDAMTGKAGKTPMVIFNSVRLDGLDRDSAEDVPRVITSAQEDAVVGATVAISGMRKFRLSFASLGKALAVLRTCETNLLQHWGFDPEVQAKLSRRAKPTGPPRYWLRSEDYPAGAVANRIDALVQFRLDVDDKGAVSGCHILFRTNPDTFATATCKALSRRAKFTPALDANGVPVPSFYIGKANWRARL